MEFSAKKKATQKKKQWRCKKQFDRSEKPQSFQKKRTSPGNMREKKIKGMVKSNS